MDLFIIKDNKVYPTPQALNIPIFYKIWEADESPKKEHAIMKLSFIEFMCSYRKSNPFIGYLDEKEREEKIIAAFSSMSQELTYDDPRTDINVTNAMDFYKDVQYHAAPSLRFYEAALSGAKKMIDFFNTLDMTTTNSRSGNPLYKPAEITRALKDTNDIIKTLGALKDKVEQEIFESSTGKGGREINFFEMVRTKN